MRISGSVPRLVLLGDIHGCRDLLLEALWDTGLARDGIWTGGTSVLIQVGDLIDRGPAGLDCMDIMRLLESGARQAGGLAVSILGNHELMALSSSDPANQRARDLWMRNGAPAVYEEYLRRREKPPENPVPQDFFHTFSPTGEYGSWIVTRPPVVIVDGVVASHAGIDGDLSVGDLQWEMMQVLSGFGAQSRRLADLDDPVFGRKGPFWNRNLCPDGVAAACAREGAHLQAIGHTPGFGLRGQVLNTDAGMIYNGTWQAAVRENGQWWAFQGDGIKRPLSDL